MILLVYYGQFYNNLEEKNLFFLNNAVTGAIMVILGILGNSLYKAFENIEFDQKPEPRRDDSPDVWKRR